MPWSRKFDDPIPGIISLREAASYIQKLPKAEQALPHWQVATEALIMAAEGTGPLLHAEIGMKRALNFGKPRPERERKRAKVMKIIGERK